MSTGKQSFITIYLFTLKTRLMKIPLFFLLFVLVIANNCSNNKQADIITLDSLSSELIGLTDSLLIDSLAFKMLGTAFESNLSLALKLEIYETKSTRFKSILDSFSVLLNHVHRTQWPKSVLQVLNIKMKGTKNSNEFYVFALDSSCLYQTRINKGNSNSITFWITDFYGNKDSFEIEKKGNRYYSSNQCLTDSVLLDSLYIAVESYQQEYSFKTYCSMEGSKESVRIQCRQTIYQIVPLCNYSRFPLTNKLQIHLTAIQDRIINCKRSP